MIADVIVHAPKDQIRLRLPIEREIQVSRKNLSLRPIVEFNNVAFGVRSDFHCSIPDAQGLLSSGGPCFPSIF
jgi:hypothetical protein